MTVARKTAWLLGAFVTGVVCFAEAVELNEIVTMKGDLRNRYEWIDEEGKPTRNRFRIRARLGLAAEVNEAVDLHLRLTTGGDDPLSANQTLGDSFSRKDFGLDRAYVDWHPTALEGLNVFLGKMPKPWISPADLLWDGDLNPEGYAVNYAPEFDGLGLLLHGGAFQVEERSSADDSWLFSGQGAVQVSATEKMALLAGGGYFAFTETQGQTVFFDSTDSFGNTAVPVVVDGEETGELLYASEYGEVEAFAIMDLKTKVPAKLYADYVVNADAATDADTGYMFGASLGKAKEPYSWEVGYNYRDLEADAVLGVFTDSDSAGGGTGYSGHRVQLKYQLAKNLQLSGTLFVNEMEDGSSYRRSQIDLIAKF